MFELLRVTSIMWFSREIFVRYEYCKKLGFCSKVHNFATLQFLGFLWLCWIKKKDHIALQQSPWAYSS
jgi:hypothetical protein